MPQITPYPETERPAEALHQQEALLVRECIRLMGRSLEPDRVIREMLHLLSELLGLDRGRVILPRQGTQLAIRHAYGLTRAEVARGRYALGEGITGRVMRTGETLIVQDIDREPAISPAPCAAPHCRRKRCPSLRCRWKSTAAPPACSACTACASAAAHSPPTWQSCAPSPR